MPISIYPTASGSNRISAPIVSSDSIAAATLPPEFASDEITKAYGPGEFTHYSYPAGLSLAINPGLTNHRLYAWLYTSDFDAGAFFSASLVFQRGSAKLFTLPLNYQAGIIALGKTVASLPLSGGNAGENSIQLIINNPIAYNTAGGEPATALLQPFNFSRAIDKIQVDITDLYHVTNWRLWVGCFSY